MLMLLLPNSLKSQLDNSMSDRLVDSSTGGVGPGFCIRSHQKDGTIDQGWRDYSSEEHSIWKTLFERQTMLLPGRACNEFIEGMRELPISGSCIPDFRELSEILLQRTGWEVVAVPGLVSDALFFEHLANRRFPSGNFIRKANQLDYLEEPDVFHDVFGHVPMLMNPIFADYMQAYGVGGLRAQEAGVLKNLARVYWYSVEFGLVEQAEGLRIYGAGISSSYSESVFSLESSSPNRIRFDLTRVMRTGYRIDDFQESYFVISGFDELLELAKIDFFPFYEKAKAQREIDPAEFSAEDIIITSGTGVYHNTNRERTTS
jgi:phenylalanine-4-hydroxylase